MSDKTEAAQKWAEAKAALDAADTAYEAAKLAYSKAEDAEFHAWQALETLSGRTSATPLAMADRGPFVTLPPLPDAHRHFTGSVSSTPLPDAHRHSLPQKPIG